MDVLRRAPRVLRSLDFAQARAAEIRLFTKQIASGGGNRQAFQTLPRSLRRRAMSHNIHRLPARLRKQAEREALSSRRGSTAEQKTVLTKKKKARRFRRYRRRPCRILRDYCRRQRKFRWLPTHIWHAKRMRMRPIWGYKLAARRADKGFRASLRAAAHGCIVYDSSYFICLQLSAASSSPICSLLRECTAPLPYSPTLSPLSSMFMEGSREGSSILYHPGKFPFGAICPFSFLWRQTDRPPSFLWMWVHPAAVKEAFEMLKSLAQLHEVDLVERRDDFVRFDLIGPRAHSIVGSALCVDSSTSSGFAKYVSPISHSYDMAPVLSGEVLWKELSTLPSCGSLPSGVVLALSATLSQRKDRQHSSSERTVPEDHQRLFHLISNWNSYCCNVASPSVLWDCLPKELSPPWPLILIQASPLTVVDRKCCSGWSLIAPSCCGLSIWLALVFAGARAIGLEEWYRIHLELGRLSFPRDWPDTLSGALESSEAAVAAECQYSKRPLSKRPNYARLGVFSPFAPHWKHLFSKNANVIEESTGSLPSSSPVKKMSDDFVPSFCVLRSSLLELDDSQSLFSCLLENGLLSVEVHMIQRGCPNANSLLFLPLISDVDAIISHMKDLKSHKIRHGTLQNLLRSETKRELLGWVTGGAHSFARGYGFGLGFVSLQDYRILPRIELLPKNFRLSPTCHKPPRLALLRTPTSPTYRPAVLMTTYCFYK